MSNWKEEILEAFKQGKTIQLNHNSDEWRDFRPNSPVDEPNLNFGFEQNWRIKPFSEEEKEQILKAVGKDVPTPMIQAGQPWEEKKYSKDEMLLFAGFCVGRTRVNPNTSGSDLWEDWEKDFPHA